MKYFSFVAVFTILIGISEAEMYESRETSVIPKMKDRVIRHSIRHRRKRWDFTTFTVLENSKPLQRIARLRSSFDEGNGFLRYSISGQGAGTLFTIDPVSGQLTALNKLDREAQNRYLLNVSAMTLQGVEVENGSSITIVVLDVNDNDPKFPEGKQFAVVKERSRSGTLVTTIEATDADDPQGPYGNLEYSLLPSNGSENFIIIPTTGQIKTASSLDRETVDTYELIVQAKDDPSSDIGRSATVTLTVSVADINDNPPVFIKRPFRATVPEDKEIGSVILRLETTDADIRENTVTSYAILTGADSDKFSVETVANQGVVKVSEPLDYEAAVNHEYRITVKASNIRLDDLIGPMEDKTEVIVRVTDVNEPPTFDKSYYTFSVREDAVSGFPIQAVHASDPERDEFTFWLQDGSETFTIDERSGMISVNEKLDRETMDQYTVIVFAGVPGIANTAEVRIDIIDVNDNAPKPRDISGLELMLCQNDEAENQALYPAIVMIDLDDSSNVSPIYYFPGKSVNFDQHFTLVQNGDNTATVYTRHKNFHVSDGVEYHLPIIVQDSGIPSMNATYQVAVQVCLCSDKGAPLCDPALQAAGIKLEVLLVLILVCIILLVIVVVFVAVYRRKRKKVKALINGSVCSNYDDEAREHVISYNEEGGGEEDTDAFDIGALQDYCSSTTGSHVKSRTDFSTPQSTVVSYLPSYKQSSRPRPNIASQDIRDFILGTKMAEDDDDRNLPFDSLQVYTYEGGGSYASSLSSLCSSSIDNEQDYDHLRDWGPRFSRLANMYGSGRHFPSDDHGDASTTSLPVSGSSSNRPLTPRKS